MLDDGDETIVRRDAQGNCHFNGDFRNANDVGAAIKDLEKSGKYPDLIGPALKQLPSIFENMFCHHKFTGRSGTFFAYEGLGSIYWHMVSKLGLAAMESYIHFRAAGAAPEQLAKIQEHIYEIRAGIGCEKSPAQYGAFPCDPYSHTPEQSGVQQPGMTGQVKEDILFRFLEIGVRVESGRISFDPTLLQDGEYHQDRATNSDYLGFDSTNFEEPFFLFSLCGIPIAFVRSSENVTFVHYADGNVAPNNSLELTEEQSRDVFNRSDAVSKIEVRYSR